MHRALIDTGSIYAFVTRTDGERETWATCQQYADKQWSYTDCALLVLARRLHIRQVFAFDAHFEQMPGLTRVP